MFLANYADVFTDAPLSDMVSRFAATDATVSLLAVPLQSSHHVVGISENGVITRVTPVRDLMQWENGGYFIMRPEIFDHIREGEDLVEDALARLVPQGKVIAYPHKGYWTPADTVKERAQMEEMYYQGNCPWMIWDPERSRRSMAGEQGETMISLPLQAAGPGPLSVLAVGAHPDDVEIAAGGTLLTLAERHPGMRVRYVLLTGEPERQAEACAAARAFTPDADLEVELHRMPDGRLPAVYGQVKEALEDVATSFRPDVILAPSPQDAHQDHRIVGELIPTAFRDHAVLNYEIPKWDGDLGRPNVYIPLSHDVARRKVELLGQVLSLATRPGLVGRGHFPRPRPAARRRMPGALCRGVHLHQASDLIM